MKTLAEWQAEQISEEEEFLTGLEDKTLAIVRYLREFDGDKRFDGFEDLLGVVNELQRQVIALKNGVEVG